MPYFRIAVSSVLFASSFAANAGDTQDALSHCAKAALSERVSEQTVVNFDVPNHSVSGKVGDLMSIDLADTSGNALGVAICEFSRSGKLLSATLALSSFDLAKI